MASIEVQDYVVVPVDSNGVGFVAVDLPYETAPLSVSVTSAIITTGQAPTIHVVQGSLTHAGFSIRAMQSVSQPKTAGSVGLYYRVVQPEPALEPNVLPEPSFTYTQDSDKFEFNGSASYDPDHTPSSNPPVEGDNGIVRYKWRFYLTVGGETPGEYVEIDGRVVRFWFDTPGQHYVFLTVYDVRGGAKATNQVVNVPTAGV